MKKTISLIIAMMMVPGLLACNRSEQPDNAAPTATEEPTATPAQTATPEPTSEPTAETTPTEFPLPENPGDFASFNGSFFWDQSSELHNMLIDIFPVDDKKAVIQLSCLDGSEDEEIATETNCSLTFELVNKAVYRNEAADITLTIDSEDHVTVTAGNDQYALFGGNYSPTEGKGWVNAETIVEFLRNISASEIGDFGTAGKSDEINEALSDSWFYEISLYRDDSIYGYYVAAADLSAICKINDSGACELIYGSMKNTLEQTNSYDLEIEGEDGEDYIIYEKPLVFPYIQFGSNLIVGQTDYVFVNAAWDMTKDIKVTSGDENVVKVDGTEITAVGAGETTLNVELVYGDCTKQYTIEVSIAEEDPETSLDPIDYSGEDDLRSEDEIAALVGEWYPNGDLGATSFFAIGNDGRLTDYFRATGEPEAEAGRTFIIVFAAGDDPHGFYAVPTDEEGGLQTYFVYSPEEDKLIFDDGYTIYLRAE